MATIREKQPGVWEVRVFTGRDERGRPTQVSRTARGGKRDAQRLAVELEGGRGRASAGGRTVADVLDAWVEHNSDTWAPSSARDQRSRVKAIKDDALARMPVARLSVADIERWHARLRRAGKQDAGIKNVHGVLRAALSLAQRWGWVNTNVASLARLRSSRTQRRGVMSVEDVRAVMAAAATFDPAAGLALRLAALAGARRAELAALRWEDVHDGVLTIDSAIEIVSRGDGDPKLRDTATKTANTRTLALDDVTLDLIEHVRRERAPYEPWMFGIGPGPVNPDRIGYWWRRARQESGIDPKWRLHDLRHWSATAAIGQGHDVRTVAERLGHADAAMTLRVYAHAFAAADKAVATGLGELLDGTEGAFRIAPGEDGRSKGRASRTWRGGDRRMVGMSHRYDDDGVLDVDLDELEKAARRGGPPTEDDVTIARDGTRLDTPEKIYAAIEQVRRQRQARQAAVAAARDRLARRAERRVKDGGKIRRRVVREIDHSR